MIAPALKFILIVGGTAFFFCVSVLAYGGFAAFFSQPALTGLAVATLLLAVAAVFVGGNLSPGEHEDRSNRWVLAVFSLVAVLLGVATPYADRIGFWRIDGDAVRWLGVALFLGGGALRLWPVAVLGNRFSGLVAIQPDHKLVTGGIYRFIRNPSYLGLMISNLGWGLAFNTWLGVLITALTLIPLVGRIRAEERLLHTQFGAEWEAYRARSWRLVPGVY